QSAGPAGADRDSAGALGRAARLRRQDTPHRARVGRESQPAGGDAARDAITGRSGDPQPLAQQLLGGIEMSTAKARRSAGRRDRGMALVLTLFAIATLLMVAAA